MPRNANGTGSNPRVTGKLSRALDALLSGEAKTQIEAAAIAGMSREHLGRMLKRPHVAQEIEKRVRSRMRSTGMLIASTTLERLAEAAESEYVKADVAKHILAINGVKPTADQSQGTGGGFLLRLTIAGQQVELGAIAGETGAPLVQSIDQQAESRAIPHVPRGAHSLTEGAGEDEGGPGS